MGGRALWGEAFSAFTGKVGRWASAVVIEMVMPALVEFGREEGVRWVLAGPRCGVWLNRKKYVAKLEDV